MPDAIFVGVIRNVWGIPSDPVIAFKNVRDALEWKSNDKFRDFKLVELQ